MDSACTIPLSIKMNKLFFNKKQMDGKKKEGKWLVQLQQED